LPARPDGLPPELDSLARRMHPDSLPALLEPMLNAFEQDSVAWRDSLAADSTRH
jgi:hypothetical protein